MKKMKNSSTGKLSGKWEIMEMELWSKEGIDLAETGYISLDGDSGRFHFICVDGHMDIRKDGDRWNFTWEGNDEHDPVSGCGYFKIDGEAMAGKICFHDGDESEFTACMWKSSRRAAKSAG